MSCLCKEVKNAYFTGRNVLDISLDCRYLSLCLPLENQHCFPTCLIVLIFVGQSFDTMLHFSTWMLQQNRLHVYIGSKLKINLFSV